MRTTAKPFNERVVKIVETCDGAVARTVYCIHDSDFGHWMSIEPFDGEIWTKDVRCRQEFASRGEAESELERFFQWRRERNGEIPWERKSA